MIPALEVLQKASANLLPGHEGSGEFTLRVSVRARRRANHAGPWGEPGFPPAIFSGGFLGEILAELLDRGALEA